MTFTRRRTQKSLLASPVEVRADCCFDSRVMVEVEEEEEGRGA